MSLVQSSVAHHTPPKVSGFAVDPGEEISTEIREELDHLLSFDGHNGFLGAGGKE